MQEMLHVVSVFEFLQDELSKGLGGYNRHVYTGGKGIVILIHVMYDLKLFEKFTVNDPQMKNSAPCIIFLLMEKNTKIFTVKQA